jgi:hypothetical protein
MQSETEALWGTGGSLKADVVTALAPERSSAFELVAPSATTTQTAVVASSIAAAARPSPSRLEISRAARPPASSGIRNTSPPLASTAEVTAGASGSAGAAVAAAAVVVAADSGGSAYVPCVAPFGAVRGAAAALKPGGLVRGVGAGTIGRGRGNAGGRTATVAPFAPQPPMRAPVVEDEMQCVPTSAQ